tara:strand:- start:124 stop:882 length:759 start_codon:yes stop_codon:yes gene_type:complete
MNTPDLEPKQTYLNEGYSLKRDLIPQDVISATRERVYEMMGDQPDWANRSWQVLDPAYSQNRKGQPLPIGIQRPALSEAVFDAVAHHPNLIAAAAELLGGEVELFTDQIGVKHGFITEEQGGRSYYHQDSYYWKIEPNLGLNCWIPLDDVDVDAIALGIKPGTQKGWELQPHEHYYDNPAMGKITDEGFKAFQRHRIPLQDIDFSDEIIFPMQAGDGLFFTNYTWHRSEANRSGETKMFYAIAYQLTDAVRG